VGSAEVANKNDGESRDSPKQLIPVEWRNVLVKEIADGH